MLFESHCFIGGRELTAQGKIKMFVLLRNHSVGHPFSTILGRWILKTVFGDGSCIPKAPHFHVYTYSCVITILSLSLPVHCFSSCKVKVIFRNIIIMASLFDVEEEIEAVRTSSDSSFDEDELLYQSSISESDGKFISTPIYG